MSWTQDEGPKGWDIGQENDHPCGIESLQQYSKTPLYIGYRSHIQVTLLGKTVAPVAPASIQSETWAPEGSGDQWIWWIYGQVGTVAIFGRRRQWHAIHEHMLMHVEGASRTVCWNKLWGDLVAEGQHPWPCLARLFRAWRESKNLEGTVSRQQSWRPSVDQKPLETPRSTKTRFCKEVLLVVLPWWRILVWTSGRTP